MRGRSEGAAALVWPALLLGVAADQLFRVDAIGINLTIWLVAAVLAWCWYRIRDGGVLTAVERALLRCIVAVGVASAWRENPMLRVLDGLALVGSAALLPFAAEQTGALTAVCLTPGQVLESLIHLGRRGLLGALPSLIAASQVRPEGRTRLSPTLFAIVRGTLLSVPAVLLFGSLLGHADPVFGDFLQGLVRFDVRRLGSHVVGTLAAGWLAAAWLGGTVAHERALLPPRIDARQGGLGVVEIGMLLGLLNLLFAAFLAFQLPYFFGGAGWVQRTAGVTLAEYARHGFFELVVVSALVLPLLLVLDVRLALGEKRPARLYRALAGWQVGLVLVMMASATHRMALYQQQFGLTEDRFFASALMAGLAVTLCWFGLTVLRGSGARFAGGALFAWAAWLALLHVVNPERVIVEANVVRAEAGLALDAKYLGGLSSDAAPSLVASLDRLTPVTRAELEMALRARTDTMHGDWRAWHYGRALARQLVHGL